MALVMLPEELNLAVFEWLELRTICSACVVSREWNRLLSDGYVWRRRYLDYFKISTSKAPHQPHTSWKQRFIKQRELLSRLFQAIEDQNFQLFEATLEEGPELNAKSKDGHTVLHRIILLANKCWKIHNLTTPRNMFTALVSHQGSGMVEMSPTDPEGNTPLHYAIAERNQPFVELLVNFDADVLVPNKNGVTPRDLAVSRRAQEALLFFDSKVPKNALCRAAKAGRIDEVKRLLTDPISPVSVEERDQNGKSALHWAIEKKNLLLVKYLVDEAGADMRAANHQGQTPAHYAGYMGSLEILQFMASKLGPNGASEISRWTNTAKESVFHYAVHWGHVPMVEYLIANGADVRAKDSVGNTSAHHAVYGGEVAVMKMLLRADPSGVLQDLQVRSDDGSTPLTIARRAHHVEMARVMQEALAANSLPIPTDEEEGEDE